MHPISLRLSIMMPTLANNNGGGDSWLLLWDRKEFCKTLSGLRTLAEPSASHLQS
jgi:hypothetical protein